MKFSVGLSAFIALAALGLTTARAHAASYSGNSQGITYSIEPIVGYELQRKTNPDRSRLEFFYGARVIAGYKILSAEGEYTQGKSDELFPDTGTRIEEKTEKIRAGLRSTYSIGSMLEWHLRGGAELQQIHSKTTTLAGLSTETDSPRKGYPYVGTGLSIALASMLSLNGSVTATIKDIDDLKKTEYATTIGVRISLGTR